MNKSDEKMFNIFYKSSLSLRFWYNDRKFNVKLQSLNLIKFSVKLQSLNVISRERCENLWSPIRCQTMDPLSWYSL